jgi:hypothetical protein
MISIALLVTGLWIKSRLGVFKMISINDWMTGGTACKNLKERQDFFDI